MEIQNTGKPNDEQLKSSERMDSLELLFSALRQLPLTDEFIPPREEALAVKKQS